MFWTFLFLRHRQKWKSSVNKQKWSWQREYVCVCQRTSSLLAQCWTLTHNYEICRSLPFSPPLIRASCGLQIMAWLEVCCIYGHSSTLHWSDWEANPALCMVMCNNDNGTQSSSHGWMILHDLHVLLFYDVYFCLIDAFFSFIYFNILLGYLGFL